MPFGAFGSTRVPAFDQYLRDNSIPIDGISQNGNAPTGITINFLPAATQQQIDWANNAKASYDWRRRRPVSRNTIVTSLADLSILQQAAIQKHANAKFLQLNPSEMANINATLGTSLPVDEVDPTETVPT